MNKNIAFICSCLLLFSAQVLADRPAMSEANTGSELLDPIPDTEYGTTDPEAPVFETAGSEAPVFEETDTKAQSPFEEASKEEAMAEETIAPVESQDEPATESTTQATIQATTQTGDVLELQSGETLPVHILDFPNRGMSMDNVQKELGEPLEISPAIGDPPISSWSYNDRTVYFEHSRVIHAVSNP